MQGGGRRRRRGGQARRERASGKPLIAQYQVLGIQDFVQRGTGGGVFGRS